MRAELSASERAVQTARRKTIYLELYPETAAGVAGAVAKHGRASENISFAKETAGATGQNVRTVQLHAERGEKVIPEVMEMIRGTKLDINANGCIDIATGRHHHGRWLNAAAAGWGMYAPRGHIRALVNTATHRSQAQLHRKR